MLSPSFISIADLSSVHALVIKRSLTSSIDTDRIIPSRSVQAELERTRRALNPRRLDSSVRQRGSRTYDWHGEVANSSQIERDFVPIFRIDFPRASEGAAKLAP